MIKNDHGYHQGSHPIPPHAYLIIRNVRLKNGLSVRLFLNLFRILYSLLPLF